MSLPAEGGIALVLVLWVIALLSAMAGAVVMTTRTDVYLAHNRVQEAQLHAAADAALVLVDLRLRSSEEADHWYPDGAPHRWDFAGQALEVRLFNETSRIDINSASATLIQGLLEALGEPTGTAQGLAVALVEWRERMGRGGAGAGGGIALGGGGNGPNTISAFTSVGDLRSIPGFTNELVMRMRPFVTVYTAGFTVNEEYASPVVRAALGRGQDAAGVPQLAPSLDQAGGPRTLGGPVYRLAVRDIDGGPTLESVFRGGSLVRGAVQVLHRGFVWPRAATD